ncbi:MAG: leucine-rich repeat protein [Muribaculaceae bacterium]|nr:leucine-rich repeat protein [Muribaculaceae bacterium]
MVIPETVTAIPDYAFYGCNRLNTVTVSGSVTSIGKYAFSGCSLLRNLIFEDGLGKLDIGYEAFYEDRITSIYLGRFLSSIPCNKYRIQEVIVGNLIEEIPASYFESCFALKSLKLGSGIKTIKENAFHRCNIKEVVIPPSVETIGEFAFSEGFYLDTIIIGPNVKTIGQSAFDRCRASSVYITAQTPPVAPDNTFDDFNDKLYLQGQNTVEAYKNATSCWNRFSSYVMIEPTEMKYEGEIKFDGKIGDTFQLKATLLPQNVTLPQLFWRSTNPRIATVDVNGKVTLHADLSEVRSTAAAVDGASNSCKIIVESLYANGPVLEIDILNESADVEQVISDEITSEIDYNFPIEVYNLNGYRIGNTLENLAPGIYIIRQGNFVKKIAIK